MNAPPATGFRWTICALIFFAITINYLDRQLFSLLVPFFEDDLKLGPTDLALINVSFILPYGLAMIFVGRAIDRIGIRIGLAGTFLVWNIASLAHGLVRGLYGFMGIRFILGLGESGMYPAAVKAVTDWFPIRERSLATGYFNAGANLGAFIAPIIGVAIAVRFGWRVCFLVTGSAGIVWIFFWNHLYSPPQESPRVSTSELELIQSDHEVNSAQISYAQLFAMRPLYGLAIAKALSDAPWWFYLTWVPKFLVDQFHVSTTFMAIAIPVVYLVADAGSIAGGWMSSHLIASGMGIGPARKLTMLVCAIAVTPVMAVGFLVNHAAILGIAPVFWAIGVLALAAGAHQGWSSNLFTLISDTMPRGAIAMAVGGINGFAMVGVSAMQFFVGRSVQITSSYTLPFVVAGTLYLVALLFLQLLLPKVAPWPTVRRVNLGWVLAGAAVVLAGLGLLQYETNRPPYLSLNEYLRIRGNELGAGAPQFGPTAHVGWMEAQWVRWKSSTGTTKLDLIKFDTHGQPFIETKGESAARYHGPSESEVSAGFRSSPNSRSQGS